MKRSVKYLIAASIAAWMLSAVAVYYFADIRAWSAHQLWEANIRPAWVRAIVVDQELGAITKASLAQILAAMNGPQPETLPDGPYLDGDGRPIAMTNDVGTGSALAVTPQSPWLARAWNERTQVENVSQFKVAIARASVLNADHHTALQILKDTQDVYDRHQIYAAVVRAETTPPLTRQDVLARWEEEINTQHWDERAVGWKELAVAVVPFDMERARTALKKIPEDFWEQRDSAFVAIAHWCARHRSIPDVRHAIAEILDETSSEEGLTGRAKGVGSRFLGMEHQRSSATAVQEDAAASFLGLPRGCRVASNPSRTAVCFAQRSPP